MSAAASSRVNEPHQPAATVQTPKPISLTATPVSRMGRVLIGIGDLLQGRAIGEQDARAGGARRAYQRPEALRSGVFRTFRGASGGAGCMIGSSRGYLPEIEGIARLTHASRNRCYPEPR